MTIQYYNEEMKEGRTSSPEARKFVEVSYHVFCRERLNHCIDIFCCIRSGETETFINQM